MDALSHRLANRILGDPRRRGDAGDSAIERDPLRFNSDTAICLAGAEMDAALDGEPVPYWQAVPIPADRCWRLAAWRGQGNAPTWRSATASTRRATWAAARRSRSGSLADTAPSVLHTSEVLRVRRTGAAVPLDGALKPRSRRH